MADPDRPPRPSPSGWRAAALAVLLALFLRSPALSLPVEGDPVAYGALARSLAGGAGYTIDGVAHDRYPPGWPAVVAVPVALGASVTAALRTTAWLLGALASGLLVLLASRWADGRIASRWLVPLAAAHPAFALHLGGLVPGSEALATVLVLTAALGAGSERRTLRWLALACAGLAPLARYDALPFSAAALALAWRPASEAARPGRARALAVALAALPTALWVARTWAVTGSPWGAGYATHGLSLARLPRNLLVVAGLLVPATTLVLLLPYVPRGVRGLLRRRESRAVVGASLTAAAAHLLLVVLFAGPTAAGDGALRFSTGTLRFGLLATPFVLVAGLRGLADEKEKLRGILAVALLATVLPLSVHLVSGGLQRALPVGSMAAGRLHLLAEAYDRAVGEAGPSDWVATDLLPRDNEGVEVFLGDRAPGRTTGVLVASPRGPRRGLFPRPPLLPLERDLPKGAQVMLVTDLPRQGVVFTGDRPDLGVGGRGLFHRTWLFDVEGGRAGTYHVHTFRRP